MLMMLIYWAEAYII